MVEFTRLLFATLAVILSSSACTASPVGGTLASTLVARTPGGIFLCDGLNWTGTCGYKVQPLNTCIVLGDDWNNKISSLGPDAGAVVVGFNSSDCEGAATAFVFPGSGDLQSIGWDNEISSLKALAI